MDYNDFTQRNTSADILSAIPLRQSLIIFVLMLIVNSETFLTRILDKFDDTIEGGIITSHGVMIQALFLVMGFVILDMVIKK